MTESWPILMYLCEKTGKFQPADPTARVRMFQWMAGGAAYYAPTNQNIFLLGNRMPDKVPDSAIKFCKGRFVKLWRLATDCQDVIPGRWRDHRRRPDGVSDLRRPQGASRQRRADAPSGIGVRIGTRPGVQKGMKLGH